MAFTKEADFEAALIKILSEHGWEKEVLHNYTEQQLVQNWADILYQNNRGIDRLNDYPLTEGEMQQVLEQIATLRTPLKLNGFINGKSVTITRDNPNDTQHFGKEVSLKIYDRRSKPLSDRPAAPIFQQVQAVERPSGRLDASDQRDARHPYRTEKERYSHQPGLQPD